MMDSGVYKLGNGLVYYVMVEGNSIRWLAERSDGHWCHIYEGEFSTDGTFEGSYVDLPKGMTNNTGTEKYNVINRTRFENVRSLGYYYDKLEEWPEIRHIRNSLMHKAGFQSPLHELTGTWLSDNGGVYYIRQFRDGRVFWMGEPERRNMEEPLPWSNIFIGRVERDSIRGKVIKGTFYDTPKGITRNSGNIEFELNGDNNEFIKIGSRIGSGRKWKRMNSVVVKIKCSSLNIIRQNERRGDEPMIAMAFFNADSSTVDWDNPAAAQIQVVSHFTGGLGSNAKRGSYLQPREHQSSACFHVAYQPKNNSENEIAKLGVVFYVIEDDHIGGLDSGSSFPWRRIPSVRWTRPISTEQELPKKRYYSPGKVPKFENPSHGAYIPERPTSTRTIQKHDYKSLGTWVATNIEHAIRNEEEFPPLRYAAPSPTKDDYIGTNGYMWEIGGNTLGNLPPEDTRGQRLGVSGDDAQYWVFMQLSILRGERVVCPDPPIPSRGGLSGGA
ncbi:hypothetical protein HZY62_15410 [Maribacter polysiphoniae]|uniref:Uncharacterized protein n=1 Tax=Maribacter polysiphoniae TaxID=429344 RepID=A0A316DUQ7_9FLAO|nr:hypothetical protein [Maribacter polysiphoniae]MBD1261989.1 hypothetical protein [Maribacter polysiphoniae]PWK21675.1 hypothetical protein LX92_03454 [Maribacter polysiphoniae]